MEEVLKKLSQLQLDALNKGISFDIDMRVNSGTKTPNVTVRMDYDIAGEITKGYVFSTTFYNNDRTRARKLNDIEKFISTITD